ncbi:hypothetical protein Pint_14064 [Pistacia integerrima]|uniref:Uncharacterized protein n=1 Tax=Pistacia integerrima TaxID=434235 RepID=A0ACC0YB31_9ROSI|nr:hypothetical protein Pint_14064 [Pistacia integerrima]
MVKGEVCSEHLGPCDDTCNSKCTSKYPNGKGSCDSISNSCKCFYQCLQPKPEICNVGIGTCSTACNDQCCNGNCAAKFPGAYEGHGVCYNVGPSIYNYCVCIFKC